METMNKKNECKYSRNEKKAIRIDHTTCFFFVTRSSGALQRI
jgi:hypothetical protein